MRWSVVRLIISREMRDLLRDRRTLFLIFGLPVILYPVFSLFGWLFAQSIVEQVVTVGIVRVEALPPERDSVAEVPASIVGGGLLLCEVERRLQPWPALLQGERFSPLWTPQNAVDQGPVVIRKLEAFDPMLLQNQEVDAILEVPSDFVAQLDRGEQPQLVIHGREGEENSKLAVRRLNGVLGSWIHAVKQTRFARKGLPENFDVPILVQDPQTSKRPLQRTADELRDTLAKFFPFILVMFTMAGALHPAIDLSAGEKERGTMETLLISPAERIEIVMGKFLATTIFSFVTAIWNVLWMGIFLLILSLLLPFQLLSYSGLIWCVLLALPLAALFAAICLALGVYAKSTKEGQYYLIPMFLACMPLSFWSMTPGMQLTFGMSLVPITGMMLLQQKLMAINSTPIPWNTIPGVLLSLTVCIAASLAWASAQFRNEAVLFREAEQVDFFGWIKNLLQKS